MRKIFAFTRNEAREELQRVPVVAYEHTGRVGIFGSEVTHDLKLFKVGCDVIVVNRWSNEFAGVADKVHARNMLCAARGGANLLCVGSYFRYTPSFVVLAKNNYGYRYCGFITPCHEVEGCRAA